jgi:hypothetical protein
LGAGLSFETATWLVLWEVETGLGGALVDGFCAQMPRVISTATPMDAKKYLIFRGDVDGSRRRKMAFALGLFNNGHDFDQTYSQSFSQL